MPVDFDLENALNASTGEVEILPFYNDTIELRYDSALHAYYRIDCVDKILVPGCTSILAMIDKSGPLTQWAANETVEWILQNWPSGGTSGVSLLREAYERFKAKCPWDELDELYKNALLAGVTPANMAKLLNEARFNYRQISKTATDIGHMAHEWLEYFIKGMIAGQYTVDNWEGLALPTNEKAANCVMAAVEWMRKHQFRPVASERKIYSLEYDYSGTFDWLAHLTSCGGACCPFSGEVLVMGDFKSSRSIYEEYIAQIAAYRRAVEEEQPGTGIQYGVVLRLGKEDGDFESLTVSPAEMDDAFDAFLGALAIYNWQRQRWANAKAIKDAAKAAKKASKTSHKIKKVKKIKVQGFAPIPIETAA